LLGFIDFSGIETKVRH